MNFQEGEPQLSQLIEPAGQGEHIMIARAGEPVVGLVSHRERPVALGGLKGRLEYGDAAFDVDPDIQLMFERGDDTLA